MIPPISHSPSPHEVYIFLEKKAPVQCGGETMQGVGGRKRDMYFVPIEQVKTTSHPCSQEQLAVL